MNLTLAMRFRMSTGTSSKQKRLFAVRYGPAIVKTAVILTFAVAPTAFCVNGEHWVGTWSTAVHEPEPLAGITNAGFQDQTLRQIVHTSIGGSRVRIRLSTFASSGVAV